MPYTEQEKDTIFAKTDGWCHICREVLVRNNYGVARKPGVRKPGAWEVEHSKARANGGTDHMNNRLPSHIRCNRRKQTKSSRAARAEHGFRAAPLPRKRKIENAAFYGVLGGIAGAIAPRIVLVPLGPAGIVAGVGIGAFLGYQHQPK